MAVSSALALFFSAGCSRNKFSVTFALPEGVNAAYAISYYASDSKRGFIVETAVQVQKGVGKTELRGVNPTLLTISVGGYRIFAFARGGNDITISSKEADPYSWDISGNKINEQWSDWRQKNRQILSRGNATEINKAVGDYVKSNPSDPLATLLLTTRYDRREDPEGFNKLWKMLKGDALKEEWISLAGAPDLITLAPRPVADFSKPLEIVVKSRGNGADTIRTGEKTVVVYCWRGHDDGRKESIDSLKRLRKAHPDSADFVIVDICFDSDSITWATPLGRDSLRHTVRAWTPLAENDSIAILLGVTRTPAFLTIPPLKSALKSAPKSSSKSASK